MLGLLLTWINSGETLRFITGGEKEALASYWTNSHILTFHVIFGLLQTWI